uniref:serine hydrolase n=1 Tax=Polynucleobacter sp. TaxID=2029855 RepID=UPI004047592D
MKLIRTLLFSLLLFTSTVAVSANLTNLKLRSDVALIVNSDTGEVLYQKNSERQISIASITKLMSALVVLDANQDLYEKIIIQKEDMAYQSTARKKLRVGTQITRREALLLGLMASENRVMNSLARTYLGGKIAFVAAMNKKAQSLGMEDTYYKDPTGLSYENMSSAKDLVILINEASKNDLIREFSTTTSYKVDRNKKNVIRQSFVNTNPIVRASRMEVIVQKTGFIRAAGRCLVMQAKISGKNISMVFMNSKGKNGRFLDALTANKFVKKILGSNKKPPVGSVH